MPPSNPRSAPSGARTRARVLVTGGVGFIGAALARELAAREARVVCLDDLSSGRAERLFDHPLLRLVVADVRDAGALRALFGEQRFDCVVHLAARVGVRAVLRDPEGCRRENLDGVRALCDALRELPAARLPRLLAASSSEVYADARGPLAEHAELRAERGRGRWAYAASKLAGERLLDERAARWPRGCGPVHLRFFNVVGPGQDSASGMVLPTFVEHARAGLPIPVHGSGSQVRCFAHVDEVARVLADLALAREFSAGPLNVGGRARACVLELALFVARLSGSTAGVVRVDPRARLGRSFEEVEAREPDLSRLARLGVVPPSMGIEEIVADTLLRHPAAASVRRAESERPACASPAS